MFFYNFNKIFRSFKGRKTKNFEKRRLGGIKKLSLYDNGGGFDACHIFRDRYALFKQILCALRNFLNRPKTEYVN